jgi:hypothetical protein
MSCTSSLVYVKRDGKHTSISDAYVFRVASGDVSVIPLVVLRQQNKVLVVRNKEIVYQRLSTSETRTVKPHTSLCASTSYMCLRSQPAVEIWKYPSRQMERILIPSRNTESGCFEDPSLRHFHLPDNVSGLHHISSWELTFFSTIIVSIRHGTACVLMLRASNPAPRPLLSFTNDFRPLKGRMRVFSVCAHFVV